MKTYVFVVIPKSTPSFQKYISTKKVPSVISNFETDCLNLNFRISKVGSNFYDSYNKLKNFALLQCLLNTGHWGKIKIS